MSFSTATINSDQKFSERLHSYLQSHPDRCDVNFSVGPNKTTVKASRIILVAASSEFQKLFEEKWDEAVVKDGEGIPLPDVDPDAFEIFLRVLPCDIINEEACQNLNLTRFQIFAVLDICKRFGMTRIQNELESVYKSALANSNSLMDTDDFLNLSNWNLKSVLASDFIQMNEIDIFNKAYRWAEHQCSQNSLEATPENIRSALGPALHEIRFPLMSLSDFNQVFPKKILTVLEKSDIFDYLSLDETGRNSVDVRKLGFKVSPRIPVSRVINSLSHISKLRMFKDLQVISSIPFVCDGTLQEKNFFRSTQKFELVGLGFLGPLESDCDYKVKVQPSVYINDVLKSHPWTERLVHAKRRQVFHLLLDEPIAVSPQKKETLYNLHICYALQGQDTQSLALDFGTNKYFSFNAEENDFKVRCRWRSKQLVELLFNKI